MINVSDYPIGTKFYNNFGDVVTYDGLTFDSLSCVIKRSDGLVYSVDKKGNHMGGFVYLDGYNISDLVKNVDAQKSCPESFAKYIVWGIGKAAPKKEHNTYLAAQNEVMRLARIEPDTVFCIAEIKVKFKAEIKVVEVQ